jgi:hypothetical protein
MTHTENNTREENGSQGTFEAMLREKLQEAVRTALITVLEAEVDALLKVNSFCRRIASRKNLTLREENTSWEILRYLSCP